MLLADFKDIAEIDGKINYLQSELASLYEQRAYYFSGPSANISNKSITKTQTHWVDNEYSKLARAWRRYDIAIPPQRLLKRRLVLARKIINDLTTAEPRLNGALSIVLIPPSNILKIPGHYSLRLTQGFSKNSDYINPEIKSKFCFKKWRIIIANTSPEPMQLGRAKDILANKKYLISGYDTRALGVYEYIATTLQLMSPIDVNQWVMLLKGFKVNDDRQIPTAIFLNGQYRLDLDDTDGVLDDVFYRPAVEVTERTK